MTDPQMTPEQAHDFTCPDCYSSQREDCDVLLRFRNVDAAAHARGRAECEKGHAANPLTREYCIRVGIQECAATHAALEAAAEKRGEERVRRALKVSVASETTELERAVISHPVEHSHDMDAVAAVLYRSRIPAELWWALTGEGERPEEKG